MIGKTISRYNIIEKLGDGGIASVYLAEDTLLKRKVAVKFLSRVNLKDDLKTRFIKEAQITAALNHPNIITVFDLGQWENMSYIVMEYFEGQMLNENMNEGNLTLTEIFNIAFQVGEGLKEAHKAGIFHRDIKPSNIRLDLKGLVKILDFGLAKLKEANTQTSKEYILGTLHYLSPEQINNKKIDHRTDIFSFGVMLYEMLTGKLPFSGDTPAAVMFSILNDTPKPVTGYKPSLPENLQRIINKAMDKNVETRYQNIAGLLAALKKEQEELSTKNAQQSEQKSAAKKPDSTILHLQNILSQKQSISVNYKKIRELTLGGLAAESDDSLISYFFESTLYGDVEIGRTKILIGNRGSGKSAIFKVLAKKSKGAGTLVEEIVPTDFMYDLLTNTRKLDVNAEWARLGAYTAAWKYVILVTAMRLLHARYKKSKLKPDDVNRLKIFLRDNSDEHFGTPIDILIVTLKKFASVTKLSLEGIHFQEGTSELDKLYKLDALKSVIPAINELSKHSKVLILFDELDYGWDSSDDARQFIAGLFRAAIQINRQFPHINILITIREEIYQNIPELYDDAQKIRDIIEHVRWTPDELKVMLSQRIKHALETLLDKKLYTTDPDSLWEAIFDETMQPSELPTFDYIVDRTLYRPRELIFFVNECLKAHNTEEKIGANTILKVEKGYSKNRLNDIASEYKFQFPGLREVFETFRLGKAFWQRPALEDHWLEIVEGVRPCPEASEWLNEKSTPDKLISILWNVGLLRAFMKADKEPTPEEAEFFVGYHQEPTLNISMFNHFDIHPMFRSHLGVP